MRWSLSLGALLLIGMIAIALWRGGIAERCAEALAEAARRDDRVEVERMVENPVVRERLLGAHEIEVGFVRPMTSGSTRVGLFVRRARTATVVEAVLLSVPSESDDGACVFLRDYEAGPFGVGL